jgi:xanthine/CO dehydrogenase XdhC/CoxF family maturation factor
MKVTYKFLVPALLAGFILGGCAEKDVAAPAEEAMEQVTETAGEMVEEAGEMAEDVMEAASNEPGGYVPTDDERVPGETRP